MTALLDIPSDPFPRTARRSYHVLLRGVGLPVGTVAEDPGRGWKFYPLTQNQPSRKHHPTPERAVESYWRAGHYELKEVS